MILNTQPWPAPCASAQISTLKPLARTSVRCLLNPPCPYPLLPLPDSSYLTHLSFLSFNPCLYAISSSQALPTLLMRSSLTAHSTICSSSFPLLSASLCPPQRGNQPRIPPPGANNCHRFKRWFNISERCARALGRHPAPSV